MKVEAFYGHAAGVYDAANRLWRNLYPEAHRALDRALAAHLPPGGSILDLGCGTGAVLERILDLGLSFGAYTGVDLSEPMLAQARARYGDRSDVRFERLDLESDPLPEGPFDLVVSTYVFEHLADPCRVASKALDRLAPGGRALLVFEVGEDSLRSRLVNRVWRFFDARLLRQDEVDRFPGLVSLERFEGPGAAVEIVVLAAARTTGVVPTSV